VAFRERLRFIPFNGDFSKSSRVLKNLSRRRDCLSPVPIGGFWSSVVDDSDALRSTSCS
jgi:hypothetical protein